VARPWRLLVDGEASGGWNMAVDESLLAAAAAGGAPTLRFYRWSGAWLSLGYRQRLDAGRLAACECAGVGVVRRVTGGRAVLHGRDLTYAIAAPEAALPDGLAATYALASEVLVAALRSLGVPSEPAPRLAAGPSDGPFDCFVAPAADEICVAGRKLVGSAQRRAGGGVLQHGSIRLAPDPLEARRASGLETGAATSLRELGVEPSVEALVEAFREAFSGRLGVDLERVEPGPSELEGFRLRASERAAALAVTAPNSPQGPSRVQIDDR
jgi:lipoate-protein ligase A